MSFNYFAICVALAVVVSVVPTLTAASAEFTPVATVVAAATKVATSLTDEILAKLKITPSRAQEIVENLVFVALTFIETTKTQQMVWIDETLAANAEAIAEGKALGAKAEGTITDVCVVSQQAQLLDLIRAIKVTVIDYVMARQTLIATIYGKLEDMYAVVPQLLQKAVQVIKNKAPLKSINADLDAISEVALDIVKIVGTEDLVKHATSAVEHIATLNKEAAIIKKILVCAAAKLNLI